MKKALAILSVIILIVLAAALYSERTVLRNYWLMRQQPALPPAISFEAVLQASETPAAETPPIEELNSEPQPLPVENPILIPALPEPQAAPEPDTRPKQINLAVPFASQAPTGNWALPFKEACEEASLIMVDAYYAGEKALTLDASDMEQKILDLVKFESALFGYYEDTDAWQTSLLAEDYFGYQHLEVIRYPTLDEIRDHLAAGRPVLMPAAGQLLNNPYFTAPGPVYHMLVLRGYTADGFFVNDPGTRHGEAYFYSNAVIAQAMHDWNDGDPVNGPPVILVIYPDKDLGE